MHNQAGLISPLGMSSADVLALQNTVGNQAVQRILAAKGQHTLKGRVQRNFNGTVLAYNVPDLQVAVVAYNQLRTAGINASDAAMIENAYTLLEDAFGAASNAQEANPPLLTDAQAQVVYQQVELEMKYLEAQEKEVRAFPQEARQNVLRDRIGKKHQA